MSWWIGLHNSADEDSGIVQLDELNQDQGGTMRVGGSPEADLNVTYNYSGYYYDYIDKEEGIKWLAGKKASETVERLEKAFAVLGEEDCGNYWKATPGNAGRALKVLLKWAKQYPDAVWFVH
jgi:hypothetical protein